MTNPTDKASVAWLDPCPLCGGTKLGWTGIQDGVRAGCNSRECGASVYAHHPNAREKAAAKWNRRAISPAQGDGIRDALVTDEMVAAAQDAYEIDHSYGGSGGLSNKDMRAAIKAALASHPDRQPGMTDEQAMARLQTEFKARGILFIMPDDGLDNSKEHRVIASAIAAIKRASQGER